MYDFPVWPDWEAIAGLESYSRASRAVQHSREFERRVQIAFKGVYEQYSIGGIDQTSGLDLMLQNDLLGSLIYSTSSFEFKESEFRSACDWIAEALSNVRVAKEILTPLRNVQSSCDLTLSPNCSIRRLTDSEISTGIGFGTLPVQHTPTRSTHLLHEYQMAIVQSYETFVDISADQEEFDRQLMQAFEVPTDELSNTVVAAINILCGRGICTRGEAWTSVKTSASAIILRERSEYPSVRRAWSTPNCDLDDLISGGLSDFVTNLRDGTVRKHLGVAVDRITTAVNRISDEEAVVDLAIAAESLFGTKDPGETTFKTSLNAAIFLGCEEVSRSYLRKFFRAVYSTRSRIVHGQRRSPKEGELEGLREELTIWMKTAILKAADELASDSDAVNWEKRLDKLLDSAS
ncbi:HEPN domain-containing protein [Nocardia sp. NBC_00565]|uniref:hypothetical protein n=1 Tax=Nocardia sp. NBC_00565 TaxID=2975993 RepID=UPI002E809173|nr:hypothetical protein [Nocardia sp. NBC_00565]WUC05154.1 HEPN domain-containing protein [Nocardia sp. NBC_00565]